MDSRLLAPKGSVGAGDSHFEEDDHEVILDKDFLKEGRDLSGKANVRRPHAPQVNA